MLWSLCPCGEEGKNTKAETGEASSLQHSGSKKEREREPQELNDSEEEGDLLEEEEEVRRCMRVPKGTQVKV